MDPRTDFALDPRLIGLPSRDELVEMRIWDNHYHGLAEHEKLLPYFDRMGIEHLFSLDIPRIGYGPEPGPPEEYVTGHLFPLLEKWKHRMSGIIRIDVARVEESLGRIERWIRNGPCIGIKYIVNSDAVTCDHPNSDLIVRAAAQLGAVIYVHTWIKVGGKPRFPGGGNLVGESTPMDLARLAARFRDVPMICGHSGGDFELCVRAIRPHKNILFEFSGGDSWAGVGDFAKQELGADRLVWGSHASTRSFATELSKVYSSDMSKAEMKKVFGTNLRRVAAGIFRAKGRKIEV